MFAALQMQGVSLRSLHKRSSGHVAFTMDPVRDLLIWAIVQSRRELAEIIWAQVTRPVSQEAWLCVDGRQGSGQVVCSQSLGPTASRGVCGFGGGQGCP